MVNSTKNRLALALVGITVVALSSIASGQVVNSGAQSVALTATMSEALTLTLSGNAVSFTLTPGRPNNPGSTDVTVTTSWVLRPNRSAVTVNAYFNSSAAALTDGSGNDIPSSAVSISDNGGAAAPLVNTVAFGGANAGLQLRNTPINGQNKNASATDVVTFNIDLSSGTLPQLPSGNYTGTLNIQAQATP